MRKALLVMILFSVSVMFVACSTQEAQEKTGRSISFVEGENQIDVLVDGNFFTSYKYDKTTLTKPVLFPVESVSGTVVTRMYPFEEVEGESHDHPHHTGIFFTYDEVNENGFWNNTTFPPQIQHLETTKMDAKTGTLGTVMQWVDKNEKPILKEDRTMVFSSNGTANCVDMKMTLTALDDKVVFNDTKEGMFAIRVAHWLKERSGNSEYLSSNGDRTAKNIWATRAKWVTLEGKKDDKVYGIAIFNHPESNNYPTYWHARDYGLFAANPLGQSVFQKGREQEPVPYNLTLEPGQSATFHFKVIVYEGTKTQEELEAMYEKYVQ